MLGAAALSAFTMSDSTLDYRGLVAETYDLWFGEEPFWDQSLFHHHLAQNGGTALEIACGTGAPHPFSAGWPAAGDMGYLVERNKVTSSIPLALQTQHGKAVTIWRKQADGTWKCVVETWNGTPLERVFTSGSSSA